MDNLTLASILCTIGAAIAGFIGGIQARGLTPDSSPNIRELTEILEAHLYATKRHLSPTLGQVKAVGGLGGKWSTATFDALQKAEESSTALHDRITNWKALATSSQSRLAGNARVWMAVAASLSSAAAALQIIAANVG